MSFQDVYHNEVLLSRRTRSDRAHFWAKVIGVVLMVIIGATLRSEPQLRQALFTAGMDGVAAASAKSLPVTQPATAEQPAFQLPDISEMKAMLTQSQTGVAKENPETKVVARPRDAVRVNRHGASGGAIQFQPVGLPNSSGATGMMDADAADAAAINLSKLLQAMKPGQ